jgi:ligand-binding sensor domain-containing protein
MDNNLFVGTDDGVMVYHLETEVWYEAWRGLEGKQVTCLTHWDHSVLAGTTDGLFSSTDNGEHWNERSQGLTERHIRSVHMLLCVQ